MMNMDELNEMDEQMIAEHQEKIEQSPEWPLWNVKSNATEKEVDIAVRMLLAYDQACKEAEDGSKVSEGTRADDLFMESLSVEDASLPFARMLMTFGATLYWNDLADMCFWVLGLQVYPNGWNEWFKYRDGRGLNAEYLFKMIEQNSVKS
jgi:hypothetical protein